MAHASKSRRNQRRKSARRRHIRFEQLEERTLLAGDFGFAAAMGGTSSGGGAAVATDDAGNVYATGGFEGTVDFDPGPDTFNLTSAGERDTFVSKLDSGGNFVWAKRIGGDSRDFGSSIAVDSVGNVYTTGRFTNTTDFDPGPGTFNLTSATAATDAFVSKLDSGGNFVWARRMGGTNYDSGSGIAVDSSGNVFTNGGFYKTVDFDPGPGTFDLTSTGRESAFVSKLDSDGNFVWARQIGGSGTRDVEASGIAIDASGNVYSTGFFQETADFDPGPGTFNLTSAGSSDVFVSKLDSGGNFVWARQMGGYPGAGIALDASGDVYTAGAFSGTADFDPGPGTFNLISAGGSDVFVSKLDSAGDFVWARQLGDNASGRSGGAGIALDASGNIYTTGSLSGTVDFDPGPGTFNLISAGSNDVFVSKLDSAGDFLWARQLGDNAGGRSGGTGIAVDGSGNIFTTGSFGGTVDFAPGLGTFNLTAAGVTNIFVSQLTPTDTDTDGDGDGIGNRTDNCPSVPNPGQTDTNRDGFGDGCSPTVLITSISQDAGTDLEVDAEVNHPQGLALSGEVSIQVEALVDLSQLPGNQDFLEGSEFIYGQNSDGDPPSISSGLKAGCGDSRQDPVFFDYFGPTDLRRICGGGNKFKNPGWTITIQSKITGIDYVLTMQSWEIPTSYIRTKVLLSDAYVGSLPSSVDISTAGLNFGESYALNISGEDSAGATGADSKNFIYQGENVLTLGNVAPSITSPAAVNAAENQTSVIDVQSDDPDGETESGGGLTYSLTGGADQDLFSINTDSGVLTFLAAPDFEAPGDVGGDNVYDVQVTVTDAGLLTDAQDIAVTVDNVNEAPIVAALIDDVMANEDQLNSALDLTNTFSDPDGDTLTLIATSANPSLVTATMVGTELVLDYQLNQSGTTTVTVRATDAGGLFVEDSLTVTVVSANDQFINLIHDVNVLRDDGVLNNGNANALTTKLENAQTKVNAGNLNPAVNQLNAFRNQVEAFRNSGKLTDDQADDLLEKLDDLMTSLLDE